MDNGLMNLTRSSKIAVMVVSIVAISALHFIWKDGQYLTFLYIGPLIFSINFRRSRAVFFYAGILSVLSLAINLGLKDSFLNQPSLLASWAVFLVLIWFLAYTIFRLKRTSIRIEAQKNRYERLSSDLSGKLEKEHENETREQERESSALKLAIRSGGVGIWEWDLVSNVIKWDDQMYLLYGQTKSSFEPNFHNWQMCFENEDQQNFDLSIQEALTGTGAFNQIFKVYWPDHQVRYIKMLGYVDRDENKKALRFVGTNWDVSQDKKVEGALQDYNVQLEQIVERRTHVLNQLNESLLKNDKLLQQMSEIGNIGGWTYSKETQSLSWTQQVFKIHELEGEKTPSLQESYSFYPNEVRGLVIKSFNNCLSRKERFELELPFETQKGNRLWIRLIGRPDIEQGEIVGVSGVFQEITADKSLKDALIKINEELDRKLANKTELLEASVKELETFSYTVSHDLRSPLRAIEGFSKAIIDNYAGILDEDGERWLNYIVANTEKMGTLISDILMFSRIGRTEVHEEELDMNELLGEKFDQLKQNYLDKVVKINVEKLPRINGDRALIGQIWLNLLGNALKFSSRNDEIEIEVGGKIENNWAHYTITDNGVGFDPIYVEKISVIFQRLHGDDEFQGSGVGLAIVERILKKHGGSFKATAELNKGATVTFSLPL